MRVIWFLLFAVPLPAMPLWFELNGGYFEARGIQLRATQAMIASRDSTVVLALEHADSHALAEGLDPLPAVSNYYIGRDPAKWRIGVPHFARIRFQDVYPGIDIVYYGNAEGKLEYDFLVRSGANPHRIQIAFNQPVHTESNGDLLIGGVRQRRPKVYQAGKGIACDYLVREGNRVEFALAIYDRAAPLTIDPVIEYATYLGGNAYDYGSAVAVDASGAAYITGYLKSPNYPNLDPFQQTSGLGQIIFVAKFTPSGNGLAWYTYVGGSSMDTGSAIALDASGNVYVAGYTASTDFPVKGAAQPVFGGGYENAVIFKLSPAGKLVYSTYLGGNNQERALGIAVDSTGAAFVSGFTWSINFPVRNALQTTISGRPDAFVAKLSPAGDQFMFATYLGGTGIEYGEGLTLDPAGNPVIVGSTSSSDFPVKGGMQSALGGSGGYATNGFITKLSSAGDRILASTYFGGQGNGALVNITSDTAGQFYVSGLALTNGWPLKNPIQATYGGGQGDVYVAKLSPALDSLVYGTYLGGSDNDRMGGVALDNAGNLYITGNTYSSDFPLKNSLQQFLGATMGFKNDAFVVKIAPSGSLLYSTLLGGHGGDRGEGIAVDPQGKVYIAGLTSSEDFPVKNPLQGSYGGGGGDIFLVRFAPDVAPVSPFTVSPSTLLFRYVVGSSGPAPQIVSVSSAGGPQPFAPVSNASWLKFVSTSASTPATLTLTADPSGFKPGPYPGAIQIDAQTSIQVNLTVLAAAPGVTAISPANVAIGTDSIAVVITGSSFDPAAVVQSNGVTIPTKFINSQTLHISLDKSFFAQPGSFVFTVVNPQSAPSSPLTLSVGTPVPQISAITNAASFATGAVAPGEIVTIFGSNLTDRVTFDNIPATLVYTSMSQVSVTVPYTITGAATQVQVGSSAPFKLNVAASAPGIFAAVSAGQNLLVLYATGCGQLTTDELPRCALPVTATVNDQPVTVLYAGVAPGLVEGANQVNIQLPEGITSGALSIGLTAGDIASKPFSVTLP